MFRVSLRSLLTLVALCALAIVSFRFASPGWRTAVLGITLVAFWAAAIVALVDRGERQVFAIGMAISMAAYGIALFAMPGVEFNADAGRLPTTRLLAPLYHAVLEVTWFDVTTGRKVANFDPVQRLTPQGANVTLSAWPRPSTFMAIGHSWWAIVLGLCGGWFARLVYLRRVREQDTLAAGRS